MWIQGKIIISDWDVTQEELVQAFEQGSLSPWNRAEDRWLTEAEIRSLAADMPTNGITLATFDIHRKPELLYGIQRAFYKKREAEQYFDFLWDSTEFIAPEANTLPQAEAIKAALLKIEGKSWRQIANYLWPNEKYENGNNTHKKVERRLSKAKMMFEAAIANFDL